MQKLDPAATRAWLEGMREAEKAIWQLETERLRGLTVQESVREYCQLQEFARLMVGRRDPEVWHREAAEEYQKLLEVFRKAAERAARR